MNILRIVYDWPDKNVITEGLAPAPYELSRAQVKLGHKVYVLCGNLNGKNIKAKKFRYELENGKIVVYNLPRGLANFGPFLTTSVFVKLYYIYLKLTKKIDVVHNHGHMGVWLLMYKQIMGSLDKTPFFGHFHNTAKGREEHIKSQGNNIPFFAKYFEYPIHKLSDKLQVKLCKSCFFVSQELIEEAKKYYNADPSKLYLAETGVNTSKFTREGSKKDFGFEQGSIIIANGGRLSQRKNIDLIVESLVYLPEQYKVVLWGTWDEDMQIKVKEIVKKNQLEKRFKYIGKIPYFEVEKCFRATDIFVLPSSYEGLPKVTLEALYSGCKVVTTLFATDIIIPDLYFINKPTPQTLADRIIEVENLDDNYNKVKKVLDANFSWDAKAKIVEEVYNK